MFAKYACHVKGDHVLIEKELIEWALAAAPSTIDIFNRTGRNCFTLGGDHPASTRFGIGVTNLHYQDPLTDHVSPFNLEHVALSVKLGHALNQFDLISTPGIAQDMAPETADLHASLAMVANTTKPLVLLISEYNCFAPALDLIEALFDDLTQKPFVIPYVNPITPLILNEETADKIFISVQKGLAFIFSNYGMSGATPPITPGGTLALLNAELLGGLSFLKS